MIWAILLVLLACSGAVSASETALFALPRQALHQFRKAGNPLLRRVHAVMRRPHQVLMTVLIANTAVNIAFFAVSFMTLQHGGETRPAVTAAGGAASLLAVILFGEIVPKAVAMSNARSLAPFAAALIATLGIVLEPVGWLLAHVLVNPSVRLLAPASAKPGLVATEELRLLVEHSARDGVIDSKENDMLQAVVALSDISVREVMTPRVDIQSVRIDDAPAAIRDLLRSSPRRRLVVCADDIDDIRGVLATRNLFLHHDASLSSLVKPARFVPEQINLVQLMHCFREAGTEFAIVVDEYGGTAGLVTMADIVERIVGDLPGDDAPDRAATTERIDDNTYRLPGDLSARVWADRFGVGEIDQHIDTVAGLILAKLGHLPRVGESVRIRNLTLTVETMHKRRIRQVLLTRDGGSAADREHTP